MALTDEAGTKGKDLLTAAVPRMLAALELCVAYLSNEGPTRDEAFVTAQKAIAHATGTPRALSATPTTITTHDANTGRVTIENIR